jgi:hypothetical protein
MDATSRVRTRHSFIFQDNTRVYGNVMLSKSDTGAKLTVCTIEMLIKVHQYLINSHTLTISLTLETTPTTTEMEATSNAQTRDNILHIRTVSHEDTSRRSEAQGKDC